MIIDTTFDFTTDSEGFWDGYWDRNDGLGAGKTDPDNASPTLQEYHRQLWSRRLPNGDVMELRKGYGPNYLTWNGFRFSSDSIIATLKYKRNKEMIDAVKRSIGDYKKYYETLVHNAYTIGGMIIFPKHRNSMNQTRGVNPLISDRWDLTLECIRRHYDGKESPLSEVTNADNDFYRLFVNFKGYVDFFFLQDCVSADYSSVNIWCGDGQFNRSGLPATLDEYFAFINAEFDFLNKRNRRIKEYYL